MLEWELALVENNIIIVKQVAEKSFGSGNQICALLYIVIQFLLFRSLMHT
jgi:hypothetical protein